MTDSACAHGTHHPSTCTLCAYALGRTVGKREGIEAAAQWLTDEDRSPGVADDMRSALLQTEARGETGEK